MEVFGQNSEPTNGAEKEESISITELTVKAAEVNLFVKQKSKDLSPSQELSQLHEFLDQNKDSIDSLIEIYQSEEIAAYSYQNLDRLRSEINKLSDEFQARIKLVTQRLDGLQQNIKELTTLETEWTSYQEQFKAIPDNTSFMEIIDAALVSITDLKSSTQETLSAESSYLNYLSQKNQQIVGITELVIEREQDLTGNIFSNEQPYIWKVEQQAKDSVSLGKHFQSLTSEHAEVVDTFIRFNKNQIIYQVLFGVVICGLLFYYRSNAFDLLEEMNLNWYSPFFKYPILSAYIFSYFPAIWLYDSMPEMVLQTILISLFIPILIIAKDIISRRKLILMSIFFALFLVSIYDRDLPLESFRGRISFLILNTALLAMLIANRKYFQYDRSLLKVSTTVRKYLLYLVIGVATFTIVLNIFGATRLSQYLFTSLFSSIGIGIVYLIFYSILTLFNIVLLRFPIIRDLYFVQEHEDRVRLILNRAASLLLLYFYFFAVLDQFALRKNFESWWNDFITTSWQFGQLQISVNDFINFFTILIFSALLARIVKYLLSTELLGRIKMRRGLPLAIATSFYYFILTLGLFLAAASTGIEWNKINLALGALGVGLGFGLQNIVYNFISGLILIYERPIQIGDIIEIGTLMGSVTSIGIRSSKVLTYDGAEVVVPNGNLVSNEVINWTLSSEMKRQELKIKTAYSADPNEVVEILRALVTSNPKVNAATNPMILFEGYGEGTLNFRLLFWTHVDVGLSTKSEIALKIYNTLTERGYEMPMEKSEVVLNSRENSQSGEA